MTMKSLNEGVSPVRTVRVPDSLWEPFIEACKSQGRKPSDVLRTFMQAYGYGWGAILEPSSPDAPQGQPHEA